MQHGDGMELQPTSVAFDRVDKPVAEARGDHNALPGAPRDSRTRRMPGPVPVLRVPLPEQSDQGGPR
jgi:hypothetical protein